MCELRKLMKIFVCFLFRFSSKNFGIWQVAKIKVNLSFEEKKYTTYELEIFIVLYTKQ